MILRARALTLLCGLVALACVKPKGAAQHEKPALAPPIAASVARAPVAEFDAASSRLRELTFHYGNGPLGPTDVVVAVPTSATNETRLPVLVTFHGRGESLKGPARGARGWVDDYALPTAVQRLKSPPLTGDDLLGFVTPERLDRMNRGLEKSRYKGLIVVCPYLPDALHGDRALDDGRKLATFIADELLPRVYRETPAIGTAETTGLDGVSLGGRAALFAGFARPEAFGVVAALQPAIDQAEAGALSDLAKAARTKNPKLVLRLLSSSDDYFLEATDALSRALTAKGVEHRFDVVVGPHSYEFNRGPGVYEMLLFHDRALRGVEAP